MPKQRIKSKSAESNMKGKLVILDVTEVSTPDVAGEGAGETYGFFSHKLWGKNDLGEVGVILYVTGKFHSEPKVCLQEKSYLEERGKGLSI